MQLVTRKNGDLDLSYSDKAHIELLGKWIAKQGPKWFNYHNSYNYYELLNQETEEVKLTLEHTHFGGDRRVSGTTYYYYTFPDIQKIKDINKVIQSEEFDQKRILEKIKAKFFTAKKYEPRVS